MTMRTNSGGTNALKITPFEDAIKGPDGDDVPEGSIGASSIGASSIGDGSIGAAANDDFENTTYSPVTTTSEIGVVGDRPIGVASGTRRSAAGWLSWLLRRLLSRMAGHPSRMGAGELSAHVRKDIGLAAQLGTRLKRSPMDWPMW